MQEVTTSASPAVLVLTRLPAQPDFLLRPQLLTRGSPLLARRDIPYPPLFPLFPYHTEHTSEVVG
jgi:hypothetical protein